jgi:Tol biopolymer transport system component
MGADGGARRHLVAVDSAEVATIGVAVWSRDGRTIYYKQFDAAGRPSIRAIPAEGGAPRLVVRFGAARQSPRPELAIDGARLYFTIAERESDVGVMTLDTARR